MGALELDLYREEFERIRSEAKGLAEGLSEAAFNWRPSPEKWSIEECLAHLTMTGQWELAALERAIEDAHRRGLTGEGPFQYAGFERYIVHMTEPPVRDPMPAPRRFVPVHGQPVTAILPTFCHLQDQLMLQVEKATGLDLVRVRVETPILWFLKLSLGMTFAQIAAHERRHLAQAHWVRRQLPAGALELQPVNSAAGMR